MKNIPTTEAKECLSVILADAQVEPIVISEGNLEVVVLSRAEYDRLRDGNIQAFVALRNKIAGEARQRGLTDERLSELLAEDDA